MSAKVKGLALDDDLDMREADRVDLLLDFIKAKLLAGSISMEDEKDIVSEACRLNISNKAPIVLCELLLVDKILTQVGRRNLKHPFDSMKWYVIIFQIKQYKRLFLRFTIKNQKAQKYLIGGIEKTIEARQEELLPKVLFNFTHNSIIILWFSEFRFHPFWKLFMMRTYWMKTFCLNGARKRVKSTFAKTFRNKSTRRLNLS